MANDYCASSDIWAEIPESKFGSSDGSTEYNDAVLSWLTTASRLVDAEFAMFGADEGFFYPATDTATRYYDGSGEEEQDIGCWVSIASVSVSEEGEVVSTGYTALSSGDYLTWPYNKTPIRKLIMDTLNGAGDVSTFYAYRKSVKVTGIPGYSTTPPAVIKQAVRMQVILWLQSAKQMYQGRGAGGEMGSLVVDTTRLDPRIAHLLHPFKLELA